MKNSTGLKTFPSEHFCSAHFVNPFHCNSFTNNRVLNYLLNVKTYPAAVPCFRFHDKTIIPFKMEQNDPVVRVY